MPIDENTRHIRAKQAKVAREKIFYKTKCYSADVCAVGSNMFQIAFEFGCFITTVNFCFDHERVKRSSN